MATPSITPNPTPAAPPAGEPTPVSAAPSSGAPAGNEPNPQTPPAGAPDAAAAPVTDFSDLLKDDLAPVADPAAPPAGGDPLAKYKDDPVIQGLIQEKQTFAPVSEVLKGNRYPIPDHNELKAQLEDSNALYDVVSGKAPASALLETMLANPGWAQEAKDKVLADLRSWIEKKTGQPIAAAAAGALGPDGKPLPQVVDPAMQKITQIEKELNDRKAAEQRQVLTQRVNAAQATISAKINSLLSDSWLAGEGDYIMALLGSRFQGDQIMQVIQSVEQGNFTQIEKAIKEIKSEEAKRHIERNKRLLELQKKKQATIPQQVSGGAPPANSPEPVGTIVELDADKRRQKMMENWRSGA